MKKEMIFNQYTGGEESLKFWDGVTMTTAENLYFWNEEEFRKWMYEDEMTLTELINKAKNWGIEFNPQNNRFYLPKGSVLKSEYFDTQKELNLEYWYNGELIDNIDSTEDIKVEFEVEDIEVEIKVTYTKTINISANSESQAESIVKELYNDGSIDMTDDDEEEVKIQVL